MFIKEAKPRIIRDSRGEKTIQLTLKTYKGIFVSSAPSGKSKGKYEVKDYNPRGIGWSLKLLQIFLKNLSRKNIQFKSFDDLQAFESIIKHFEAKFGEFGGNCVYVLESCFLKAAARENNKELWEFLLSGRKAKIPMPVGNCIGGGLHSRKVKWKRTDFQEFLFIPDEEKFSRAVTKNFYAYEYVKKLIKKQERKWIVRRNDENAWNTGLTNEECLEIMRQAADKYELRIGVDVASSTFYKGGYYNYENKRLTRDRLEQIDYMKRLIERYEIFYAEDPMDEEDFSGFLELKNSIKKKSETLIVGDDLTVTNMSRLRRAVRNKEINAVIVKPNQVGSLVEVRKVADFCRENKIKMIFSHRSGETMDDALADFAVGLGADFIKCGIFGRERLIKLRRVMEIERKLG